jgi:DNA-directed RNA polymerase subunit RPC12/RpoP
MPGPTYFTQECPTCGRRLQIRVDYLGKKVVCQHCRGELLALDASSNRYPESRPAENLLRRANKLLDTAHREKESSYASRPR